MTLTELLFHTSANMAGKLYDPSINNVGKPELTEERGYFRVLISNTGCATDCFPPNS